MVYGRKSFFLRLTELFENTPSKACDSSQNKYPPGEHKDTSIEMPGKNYLQAVSKGVADPSTSSTKIESQTPVNPEIVRKGIIIGYCLIIIFSTLYVPWRVVGYTDGRTINYSLGYSFVFSSPLPSVASIDYGLVIFEMIASTAIAIILYVLRDRLAILINQISK